MIDTPLEVKQLVKTSHFAFFTVIMILAILLFNNNIVHAQTVSGSTNGSNWSYDDSSMESAVVKYKLYMPEDTSFLNQEDSGFPYQMPCFDNDGMGSSYTRFRGSLGDKNFIDTGFVSPTTFNNQNTSFAIPDSFTINGSNYNTGDFSSANMFVTIADYHPIYYLVLSNDSSSYNAISVGAGFSFWESKTDDNYIFEFSEGMYLTSIYKPYDIYGRKALFYGPVAFCGNSPIMSYFTDNLPSSRPNAPDNWFQFVDSDHAENINYIQLGGDNKYDDGSGGDADNNLYVRSADWKFNIPKYCNSHGNIQLDAPATRNWGEGTVIFSALLNDWQKANPDKLNIDYNFHVYLYIRFENDVNDDVGFKLYNFDADLQTQGLSDFIEDGCSQTFKVFSIFQYCRTNQNHTVTDILDSLKQHSTYDILDTVWYLDCTATIKNAQNQGNSSGPIKERYNFTNQISKELENTITENKNPYVDDEGKPHIDVPDDNSSDDDNKTHVSGGDNSVNVVNNNNPQNNITINNNPNNTINNSLNSDSFNPIQYFTEKLISQNTETAGNVSETLGVNPFVAFLSTTFGFVPSSVWTTLSSYFVIFLGIVFVAFIIKILLSLL